MFIVKNVFSPLDKGIENNKPSLYCVYLNEQLYIDDMMYNKRILNHKIEFIKH